MRVITAPIVEPITIAEAKAQLGIQSDDAGSDAIISRRITEARQWAEDYMQRALITQIQEIRLDAFPYCFGTNRDAIKLPFPNLLTVVHVKYIDLNGTEQTISAADYVVDTYSFVGLVRPAYGVSWPAARTELNAVRIQYTCGYGATALTVPALIREGLLLLVGHWMNFQPQSENGTTLSRVPFAILDIFNKYKADKFA